MRPRERLPIAYRNLCYTAQTNSCILIHEKGACLEMLYRQAPEAKVARPNWTFLTNHGLVLTYIGSNPECTGLQIAAAVGVTERAVRSIVADLHAAGYITPQRIGRGTRYQVNTAMPLRHEHERAVTVGELLRLLQDAEERAADAEVEPRRASTAPADTKDIHSH